MKKTFVAAAAVIVFLCALHAGCAKDADNEIRKNPDPDEIVGEVEYEAPANEEPDESPDAQTTKAVTADELFPDWQISEDRGDSRAYENVTPQMVRDYTDMKREKGFTLIENDKGMYAKILYCGEAWIELADNTVSQRTCSVGVRIAHGSGPLSPDEAGSIVKKDAGAAPLSVLEKTPDVFDGTGLQLFDCLFDTPPADNVEEPIFHIKTYVVGENTAVPIYWYLDSITCDTDGNGDDEAVILSAGPTSGVYSIELYVFKIEDGEIITVADSIYRINTLEPKLNKRNGRAVLVCGEQEFELAVKDGNVFTSDDEGNLAPIPFS